MIIGTGASTISIGAWNICGIKSKLEDPDFLEELLPHDIIILGETFAENENIHVPGYKCKNVFRKWKQYVDLQSMLPNFGEFLQINTNDEFR